MKIKDFISKSIQEYPSLYKDVDYEKSKLKVLNHVFFVYGNGLELADTGNPDNCGYVVEPKHKYNKKEDGYKRLKDKPYGEDKYKPIPEGYFDSVVYYVHASEYPLEIIKLDFDRTYYRYSKDVLKSDFSQPKLYKAQSFETFSPYPFCEYSIIHDVYEGFKLEQDWLDELIILCERTLEYFNDRDQYIKNSYYPSEYQINSNLKHFEKEKRDFGSKGIIRLRKLWGYEESDIIPTYDEITNRKYNIWEQYRNDKIDYLTKFLSKHGR